MNLQHQQKTQINRPHRTRGKPTDDGEFILYEHVPIFDEHVGDDGVPYDERLLRAIAANCNRRIQTTGDWCPIVVAHTRDQDEKRTVNDDPPVVGLAGPFYVADFTNAQGQLVKAIYSMFWVFAEDDETFRKNPRRSVEIWPEDKPENRYFDPISVLGAETPKRDLGLIYSKRRRVVSRHEADPCKCESSCRCKNSSYCIAGPFRYSKRSVEKSIKYQAMATVPGGNNTFVPGLTKPQKHAKGVQIMPLAPEDISQIVEALKPTMQAMMDEMMGGGAALDPGLGGGADLGAPPPVPGDPGLGGGAPPDLAGGGAPPPDLGGGAPPPGPDDGPAMPEDDGIPSPDQMDDDAKLYAKGLGRKFGKYRKEDGSLDEKGADAFMGSLDDDDKKHLGSYMKYMCDDDDTKQKYALRYGKSPIGGTDVADKVDEMKTGEPQRYAREGAQRYAKLKQERDNAVQRYSKLHKDHEDLKVKYAKQNEELSKLRVKERYSKRFAQLTELSVQYNLDPEEEMALTDDLTDSQFDKHVKQIIPQRYSRVSGNLIIPDQPPAQLRQVGDDRSQRYAKQAGDVVQKYRKQGKNIQYRDALNHLVENNGEVKEDVLFATPSTNGNGKQH